MGAFDDLIPQQPQAQQQQRGFIPGTPKPGATLDLRSKELGIQKDQISIQQALKDLNKPTTGGRDSSANVAFDNEAALRKEFTTRQEVQNYQTILPQFASAVQAGDNGAGDLQLIYAFGKIMDPGSVVREGELELAQGTGSEGEKLKGWFQQVTRGGRLTPVVRKQLLDEVRRRGSTSADAYNQSRKHYSEMAQGYGIDPSRIVGAHPGAPFQQAEADFVGRPIRNLDGSQGAVPRGNAPIVAGPQERAFGDQMPPESEIPIPEMTPEQQAAYEALVSSGATADQIRTFGEKINKRIDNADEIVKARDQGLGVRSAADAVYNIPEETQRLKQFRDGQSGPAGALDVISQGMSLGLSDEAAGLGNAAANLISSPFTDTAFDPVGAYQAGKGAELMRVGEARDNLGAMGTAAEIGGGFLSGNPTNAMAYLPMLLDRVKQGAKAGAAGGALAGFGYGNGAEGSLLSAAGGAAGGTILGGGLPVAGQAIRGRVSGVKRLLGKDPELPRRLVGDAIAADANTPRAVGQAMSQAQGRGSPLTLADTGENARALLGSVSRQPGPSRTIAVESMVERQKAQFERVAAAVRRDLGPTANIREKSDELIEGARTASAPLYDAFRAAPGASSVNLSDLATRPAFKKAMRNAMDLASEEGADPTALGFAFNEAGDVVLERVPSWETLDFVKRGLDDVVEGFRDSTTGKLNLNTGQARATNGTLRSLIARMDKVNKHYAPARAAYAGPAKMRDALQKGAKALNRSPDDLAAEMKLMGEPEREMYRMGLRKSIVDMMASRVDGGDKVSALIGTPKKRAAMLRAFGSKAEYDRFINTLRDEEAMHRTYRSVATGSPTAERMAADAITSDSGLAETAVDAALRGSKDGIGPAIVNAIVKLRDVGKFGAGKAGEATRESIAALLTESDPTVLREIMVAARRATARQRLQNRGAGQRAARVGQNSGQITGNIIGRTTEKPSR